MDPYIASALTFCAILGALIRSPRLVGARPAVQASSIKAEPIRKADIPSTTASARPARIVNAWEVVIRRRAVRKIALLALCGRAGDE